MLNIEDFKEIFDGLDIAYFQALSEYGVDISLQTENIEEFKRFILLSRNHIVFFQYHYHIKEDYSISESDIGEFLEDGDFANTAMSAMSTQNDKLNSIDFSRPFNLTLYCIYNGQSVGFDLYDNWLPAGLMTADSIIETLQNQYDEKTEAGRQTLYDQWKAEKEQEKQIRDSILAEIEDHIRNDESWKKCTNISRRRDYSRRLAEEWTEKKDFHITINNVYNILDICWAEYKESLMQK